MYASYCVYVGNKVRCISFDRKTVQTSSTIKNKPLQIDSSAPFFIVYLPFLW